MENSNHSEHRQDGIGKAMHEGHCETESKTDDHTGHHVHMAADFQKRFWISLALTLPILLLSPMLQTLVGLREAIRFPGDIYVLFGFSSAVFWYGGWSFLKGLFKELKSRQHGKLSMLFDMTDFHGWEAAAMWEDTKFAIKHFADIERLAMVGEKRWQHGIATFCKPFTKAKILYFDHADDAAAMEWLAKA